MCPVLLSPARACSPAPLSRAPVRERPTSGADAVPARCGLFVLLYVFDTVASAVGRSVDSQTSRRINNRAKASGMIVHQTSCRGGGFSKPLFGKDLRRRRGPFLKNPGTFSYCDATVSRVLVYT